MQVTEPECYQDFKTEEVKEPNLIYRISQNSLSKMAPNILLLFPTKLKTVLYLVVLLSLTGLISSQLNYHVDSLDDTRKALLSDTGSSKPGSKSLVCRRFRKRQLLFEIIFPKQKFVLVDEQFRKKMQTKNEFCHQVSVKFLDRALNKFWSMAWLWYSFQFDWKAFSRCLVVREIALS